MDYPKKSYFKNYVFMIDEHVYEPAEDTFLIADNMLVTEGETVLDMGTGCGILAVLAAKKTKKVVAVDINPHAIRCASRNAEANNVRSKIEFHQGDLFKSFKKTDRFSLILFNSPYLPSDPDEEKTWIGKAWAGGPNGRLIIDKFIEEAPRWLDYKGEILFVQSSLSNVNRTLEMFNKMNLKAKTIAKVKVPFENIVLIKAKHEIF